MTNPTKKSRVWIVERTDWFGECEMVANFHTKREADAFAKKCQRASDATDRLDDKVRYTVTDEIWERPA